MSTYLDSSISLTGFRWVLCTIRTLVLFIVRQGELRNGSGSFNQTNVVLKSAYFSHVVKEWPTWDLT